MGDDCAPGCDHPIVGYHARRGGKELCRKRGKDELMGAERYLAERWAFNEAQPPTRPPTWEVLTEDQGAHILFVEGQPFAEHIVTLHNRTFGDGQDAPERRPCPRDTNGDGDCGQPLCPDCGHGRILRGANRRRDYLPDDLRLSRRYGPGTAVVSDGAVREGVERLVYELVSRRVAEYMSAVARPMPITASTPLPILANVLRANGYVVFGSAAEFEQAQSVGLDDSDSLARLLEQRGYQVTHPTLGDTT